MYTCMNKLHFKQIQSKHKNSLLSGVVFPTFLKCVHSGVNVPF